VVSKSRLLHAKNMGEESSAQRGVIEIHQSHIRNVGVSTRGAFSCLFSSFSCSFFGSRGPGGAGSHSLCWLGKLLFVQLK